MDLFHFDGNIFYLKENSPYFRTYVYFYPALEDIDAKIPDKHNVCFCVLKSLFIHTNNYIRIPKWISDLLIGKRVQFMPPSLTPVLFLYREARFYDLLRLTFLYNFNHISFFFKPQHGVCVNNNLKLNPNTKR